MRVFSAHTWHAWRFKTLPHAQLVAPPMLREFFDALAPQVGVTQLDAWLNVSFRELQTYTACGHIKKLGLLNALQLAYPEHDWGSIKTTNNFNNEGFAWEGTLESSQHYLASLLRKYVVIAVHFFVFFFNKRTGTCQELKWWKIISTGLPNSITLEMLWVLTYLYPVFC